MLIILFCFMAVGDVVGQKFDHFQRHFMAEDDWYQDKHQDQFCLSLFNHFYYHQLYH